jgi:ABC-2 type transport system permease protein
MNKIFAIARWEFLEKVKTKAFVISLIITPIIIISFSIIPSLLGSQESERTKIIGLLDSSNVYFNLFKEELEKNRLPNEQINFVVVNLVENNKTVEQLTESANKRTIKNSLYAYLLIRSSNEDSIRLVVRHRDHISGSDLSKFESAFNRVRIKIKLNELSLNGFDPNFLDESINIKSEIINTEEDGLRKDLRLVFFSSIIMILLLMMMVIYSGQMLVRSLIEEKSNRLIEVLVSSCTPDELLAGKILGLSSLGLTQIFIWSLIAISLVGGAVVPPELFSNAGYMLIFFILGFLFYTTLFVGIGSIVNTEQEAQLMTTYLSILLMFPIVVALPVIQNPDSLIIKIFSYIPFTIPSVMLLRINIGDLPDIDIWISILLLMLSIILVIKISAKIFRIGALLHGSKPTVKEIISWLKSDA